MTKQDMVDICLQKFSHLLPLSLSHYIPHIVEFCESLHRNICLLGVFGRSGSPWEFNLRDAFRVCEFLCFHSPITSIGGGDEDEHMVKAGNVLLCEAMYSFFVARLRNLDDRMKVCELFEAVFMFPLLIDESPSLRIIANEVFRFGLHILTPFKAAPALSNHRALGDLDLIRGTRKSACILSSCINMGWPALLTGSSGSGKRRSVAYLASLLGAKLVSFPVTTTTDTTEILGSFEQCGESRLLSAGMQRMETVIMCFTSFLLLDTLRNEDEVMKVMDKMTQCVRLFTAISIQVTKVLASNSLRLDEGRKVYDAIHQLFLLCSESLEDALQLTGKSDHQRQLLVTSQTILLDARTKIVRSHRVCMGEITAGFEWVDGAVVEAVQKGHWLMIENVNLCPSSVLDRLNSLLEPSGSLLLSESGEHRLIRPHPNFRVILTMDPIFGIF